MKFTAAQQIHAGMIELDLQQAWECLSAGEFDLCIQHFEAAIVKTKELETACKPISPIESPKPHQTEIPL